LLISIPLFVAGYVLTQVDFAIIWRYFAWSNQTLAAVVLWTITVYLVREQKTYFVTLLPALFMTIVITSYLFFAPEGFNLSYNISLSIGFIVAVVALTVFEFYRRKLREQPVILIS